ncbi:MAG: 3-hydroxyacyl-ACP dehydratase FabZ [Rhodobacteraceae bacterium]|jgi:3-hydroxyacyl-[acyl-carrier-protein] dehydratase|nr:3-hydroxyacyl-ACP dehydratase FabZ [Paracoccaceae bacterium]
MSQSSDLPQRVGIVEIQRLIPHRYPFLMIDAVEDIVASDRATGIKNVTINEPYFQGHFPAKPLMPGVLIIEAMAQTASVLISLSMGLGDKDPLVYFMTVDKGRFRRPVEPGNVLKLHTRVARSRAMVWKFDGVATVNGARAAEATFSAMVDISRASGQTG